MKTIERHGVDIRVALASYARQGLTQAPLATAHGVSALPAAPGGLKQRAKRLLRRAAKLVFKLLRPVGSPLAFRLRAYFNTPLHTEFARIHERLQAEREHNQRQVDKLEKALAASSARALRDGPRARAAGSAALPPDEVQLRTAHGTVRCDAGDPALLLALLSAQDGTLGAARVLGRLLRPGGTAVTTEIGPSTGPTWRTAPRPSLDALARPGDRVDVAWIAAPPAPAEAAGVLDDLRRLLDRHPDAGVIWQSPAGVVDIARATAGHAAFVQAEIVPLDGATGAVASGARPSADSPHGVVVLMARRGAAAWHAIEGSGA